MDLIAQKRKASVQQPYGWRPGLLGSGAPGGWDALSVRNGRNSRLTGNQPPAVPESCCPSEVEAPETVRRSGHVSRSALRHRSLCEV